MDRNVMIVLRRKPVAPVRRDARAIFEYTGGTAAC